MNGFQKALERITDPNVRARVHQEEQMVEALVDACLTRGYAISVFDSEEWPVIRSIDKALIMAEMFATDDDTLVIHDSEGNKCGWFLLIYGNDGWDVVSDHSANLICDEIWNQVLMPLSDKLEAGEQPQIKEALQLAESFISGFEDDPLQEGVDEMLVKIRGAIAQVDA